jgi:hypothetical protein
MGSITKYIDVAAPADTVWDAVRDFGALHQRLVPGFVVGSTLDGQDRVITFVTGAVARERIVSLDDDNWRLVYAVVESALGFEHHQSSVEIVEAHSGNGSRIEWTTDFLPDALGETIDAMMDHGGAAMGRAFGTVSAPAPADASALVTPVDFDVPVPGASR